MPLGSKEYANELMRACIYIYLSGLGSIPKELELINSSPNPELELKDFYERNWN